MTTIRFVVSGVHSDKIATSVRLAGGNRVQVATMSDLEGARAVKAGQADYYIGACWTGGGGALAMAIAILGPSRSKVIATQGVVPSQEMIERAVESGAKAFGMNYEQIETVVPMLVKAILNQS